VSFSVLETTEPALAVPAEAGVTETFTVFDAAAAMLPSRQVTFPPLTVQPESLLLYAQHSRERHLQRHVGRGPPLLAVTSVSVVS